MGTRRHFIAVGGAASLVMCGRAYAQGSLPMNHIVLLGDSVFDNAAYVAGEPDVVRQLVGILPAGWGASLNARDGAVIADVSRQLRLPAQATHLVISAGGNDALGQAHLLDQSVGSMAEALDALSGVRERFRAAYAAMLDDVIERRLPTAVCTIYEPRFSEAPRRKLAATALTVLNDAITREAFTRGIDCIDLRVLCNDDADFANPIEPSVLGGQKIAQAILAFARHDKNGSSRVIAR